MNTRRIFFSAIVTAIIGAILGALMVQMRPYFYPNQRVNQSPLIPMIIGVVFGLLAGGAQESVRELRTQQDQEERLKDYLYTYLRLRDMEKKIDK